MQTPDTLRPAAQQILANAPNWRQAVTDLVELYSSNDAPFTSGHVVREIRTTRPDLAFRQRTVGEQIQDMYWTGRITYQGNTAVQVPRTTTGKGRTPAGVDVFVYAPDTQEAYTLDFEIDIPSAGGGPTQVSQMSTVPQMALPPSQGVSSPVDYRCAVHSDNRLCVPRAVMDALSAKSGQTVSLTTEAWVSFDGDLALVSFEPTAQAVNYSLQANRGRVLFPRSKGTPFNPGVLYQGKITTVTDNATSKSITALVIDLANEI